MDMGVDTMPAGPEMDRLVAEKVMGWTEGKVPMFAHYVNGWIGEGAPLPGQGLPLFSTDIAAAWKVKEKLSGMGIVTISTGIGMSGGRHVVEFVPWGCYSGRGGRVFVEAADDEDDPVAICRAALKAVGVE